MNKEQYMVQESDKIRRKEFYDYIVSNYTLKVYDSMYKMIHSHFPFIVDFKDNSFWVCESITCCACAAQKKKIITIDQFKSLMK